MSPRKFFYTLTILNLAWHKACCNARVTGTGSCGPQDNYFSAYDRYRIAENISAEKDEVISQLFSIIRQPKLSSTFLAVFGALVGGKPIPSSVGGGSDDNDLRWDGRNPDEDENAFRYRAILHALKLMFQAGKKRSGGYHR